MKMTRRNAGRILLGVPLAAATAVPVAGLLGARTARAADDAPPPPETTPLAKFLAKHESGLSSQDKEKVRKDVTELEQALKTLREFPLANDIPPAGSFRALRSSRGARGSR